MPRLDDHLHRVHVVHDGYPDHAYREKCGGTRSGRRGIRPGESHLLEACRVELASAHGELVACRAELAAAHQDMMGARQEIAGLRTEITTLKYEIATMRKRRD
jgi:uncharacterized protein (DUF3084 family)